jgi:surface carbohydrate biosynthesis protein
VSVHSTAAGTQPAPPSRSAVRARRRTLYIFVEVGARELLSRLVLAEEARRRGYRVILGEKNLLRNLCWLFRAPPGIILDKCGQICRSHPIRALKRRGFRYVVLDEEGIFFSHAKRAPEPDDVLLFNNEYQRRLSNRPAPPGDVVGNPRLHPRTLLPYLKSEVGWIREKYGEFVLVCSSFDPKVKSSYALPEEEQLDARFRQLFLEIIRRVSRAVPVVYRPHPSDGEEFAAQVATMVPVERHFTILPWITASRLVVNAKCSSSFEAVRLGVPSATLCLKSAVHVKLNALSRRFYDVDSICRYIEGGVYGINLPRYKRQYVALISGPEEPQRRLLDRLDAIGIPETGRFDLVKRAATITRGLNGLWYGRGASAYISAKYGSVSYADRFPGFAFHLGGQLVVSND